ncbi:diacylglycerol/polyprenol kinase family protein [Gemmatimonadota bacterium]
MSDYPRHELIRKAIHVSMSVLPLSLFALGRDLGTVLIATALTVAIVVDIVRLRWEPARRFFERLFGESLRPHERYELTGSTFMGISALVCVILFTVPIAVAALLFLTIGDSAAALVGMRWGRTTLLPGKTLEGTLACLVSCSIIGIVVPGVPFIAGITGALVASTVELLGIETIDDNFGIPILSALAMWIVASVVG